MQARVNSLAVLLLVLALLCPGLARAASAKTPGATRTNSVPTFKPVDVPQSLFLIPANPREGRNPFFPQSIAPTPAITTPRPPNATTDFSSIVLNGITSPPKRTAMINGRTFEAGEEGDIKLPNGVRVLIKCEEIKGESAIIRVNGQPRELRLRFGL